MLNQQIVLYPLAVPQFVDSLVSSTSVQSGDIHTSTMRSSTTKTHKAQAEYPKQSLHRDQLGVIGCSRHKSIEDGHGKRGDMNLTPSNRDIYSQLS